LEARQAASERATAQWAPEAATPDDRVRVLYIGGTGRTGSTLLTRLLGQYDQFFAAGELAFLWRFLETGKCGCGRPLRECPVWEGILKEAYGGPAGVDPLEMTRLRQRFNSTYLPLMITPGISNHLLKRCGDFPQTVERLYHGIAKATGCRVIVDSSKEPHYSYILRSTGSLDVFFLHLVRDPRAIAYSWKENRKTESGLSTDALMENRNAFVSSAFYDVSNVAAEIMWKSRPDRYKFLRYEDFLADPEKTIRSIGSFVGEDIDPTQVLTNDQLTLGELHIAWGNPNRFDRGQVTLRKDETWRSRMSQRRRLAVTALTSPVAARYGYPLSIS
jgi:hypothetical protein